MDPPLNILILLKLKFLLNFTEVYKLPKNLIQLIILREEIWPTQWHLKLFNFEFFDYFLGKLYSLRANRWRSNGKSTESSPIFTLRRRIHPKRYQMSTTSKTNKQEQNTHKGRTFLPYITNVTDGIGKLLENHIVKGIFRPYNKV